MKPLVDMVYLASKSPRRRDLLRQIGVRFEVLMLRGEGARGLDVSETLHPGESAPDYVARVTHEKAAFGMNLVRIRHLAAHPILAADTCVVIDGAILGKPENETAARAMLQRLSGQTHQVLTAIALHHHNTVEQITQVSQVRFARLSPDTINAYCATQEPYDKAGGYGIQGAAALFVEHIEGSYSGIMGLPLFETAQLLRRAGMTLL